LRTDLTGGEFKVGCTYHSHGSANGYECSGHHDRWAIDFIATQGTPVYAAGAGYAVDATGQAGGSGYGRVVRVQHANGVQTLYAHLSRVDVPATGRWVDEDTVIGAVGSTGSSSTPHLHYERQAADPASPSGALVAVDPGPLRACRAGYRVAFPENAGRATWEGVAWGAFRVASEGTDCTRTVGVTAGLLPGDPVTAGSATSGASAAVVRPAVDPDGPRRVRSVWE
jgi:hypothetical protein